MQYYTEYYIHYSQLRQLVTLNDRILMRTVGNGSHSRNRPCQDVRFTKNGLCIIDRGARYKVYAQTNTSRLFTCHWWLTVTRAACHSLASANDEEAHLVARADRGLRGAARESASVPYRPR